MSELIYDEEEIRGLANEIEHIGTYFDEEIEEYIATLIYIRDQGFKKGLFNFALDNHIKNAKDLSNVTGDISKKIKNDLYGFLKDVDSEDSYR